jgi:transposase-like protein
MYVQGVSTRKVITVLQALLGPDVCISSTQVSRAAEALDTGLAAWRERPLGETPYVFFDARYERVREGGRLIDCAVLVAVGITADGHLPRDNQGENGATIRMRKRGQCRDGGRA